MPLPDERPRQSVANLIGKFETKHPSPSNPSRSSSVVSHITGDSTKEEIKDKREWPPKSVVEKTSPGPSRLMPSMFDFDGRKSFVKPEPEPRLATKVLQYMQQKEQQEAPNEPNSFLENWRKDLPQPIEMEPEIATPKLWEEPPTPILPPVQQTVPIPPTPKTPVKKASATKVSTSTSSKSVGASAKAQPKSASKSTPPKHSSTPATPLKPQLTGHSVVSSSSRKTVSKPSISAKTPPRAGSKTPTSTSRPKTPSSGLFAPTAASLAKARNALPPPPPPIKKTTISSDTMDRLSRPTAASLSRIKSGPAPVASTTKSPPRGSSVKSKPTTSPSKSPQSKIKKDAAVPQTPGSFAVVATVAGFGVALAAAEPIPDETPAKLTMNGHLASETAVTEVTTKSEVEPSHQEEETVSGDVEEPEVDDADAQTPTEAESEEAAPKTNLEDIVNLLETVPVARPSVEEISEIPDEDDK